MVTRITGAAARESMPGLASLDKEDCDVSRFLPVRVNVPGVTKFAKRSSGRGPFPETCEA
jgi:hypothetical protein